MPPRWVAALAAVAFDPDVGQKIEALCPANALSEEERRAVAFASLPDSVSALDGGVLVGAAAQATSVRDSFFFYRVKRSSPTSSPRRPSPSPPPPPPPLREPTAATAAAVAAASEGGDEVEGERPAASSAPSPPQTPSAAAAAAADADAAARYGGASPAFLYGFVVCRQRRDPALRRGGDQRAVVVLSEQPYSATLAPLARAVAAAYFNSGVRGLERAWEEVRRWPAPRAEARTAAAAAAVEGGGEGGGADAGEGANGCDQPPLPSPRFSFGIRRTSSSSSRGEPGTPRPARVLSAAGATLVACSPDASVLPPPAPRSSRLSSSPSSAASLDFRVPRHPLSPLPEDLPIDADGSQRAPHGVFPESDVWSPFGAGLLERLWHLWEATLTATPTLVLARTPGQASAFVAALLALVAPLPYGADFRPYLTIHDADAAPLAAAGRDAADGGAAAARGPPRAGGLPRLVGATNPHFSRALGAGWPVVVSLGGAGAGAGGSGAGGPASSPSRRSLLGAKASGDGSGGGGRSAAAAASAAVASLLNRSPPRPGAASPSRLRRAAAAVAGLPVAAAAAAVGAAAAGMRSVSSAARGESGGGSGGEPASSAPAPPPPPPPLGGGARALAAAGASAIRDVLWSEAKPLVKPDRALLSRLLKGSAGGGSGGGGSGGGADPRVAAANSAALRRSFRRLTEGFLSLFDPFFDLPGPPPGSSRLPPGGPPPPPPFSHSLFLEALADPRRNPPVPGALLDRLGSRAGVVALARRFLASPNFASWFERRRAAARGWQAAAWEAAAAERGEGPAPRELGESELVDAFAALEERIGALESALAEAVSGGGGEADSASPPDLGALSLRRQSSASSAASAASSAASSAAANSTSSKKKHHRHHRQHSAARRRLSCLRNQAAETYAAMPDDLKQAVTSAPSRARLVESLLLGAVG